MTFCINPHCSNPQNADTVQFCQTCGSELLLKLRYRVMRELGSGGFGRTYEVSDQGTLKVLKVLINNSPKAVELFQREAEVLSQLASPSIPKVEPNSYFIFHPSNSQEPLHCLVMEKVEGMNLREYLKQRGRPVDSDSAQRWLVELLAVLQQVHDAGILHRDIKPQNIIFKPDGKLALIDFGAVREGTGTEVATAARTGGTEVATQAGGTSIVSAGYTAPEQVNGQAMKQSDFYSLGRTFIFLLTGKEPSSLAYDAYNDALKWREYAPGVEPKLAELLDQMTAISVRQRPANTQEMLQPFTSKPASASSATFKTQFRTTDSDNSSAEYIGSDNSATSLDPEPNSAISENKTQKAQQQLHPENLARNTSGIFWKWFLATLAGYIVGFIAFSIVVLVIAVATTGTTDAEALDAVVQTRWSSAVAWSVFGLALGTLQWFVLRKRMPKAGDWIGATVLGFGLDGSLMAASKVMSFSSSISTDPLRDIGIAFCGGLLIGLAQWMNYLRKHVPGSAWWVVLVITSSVIGGVMGVVSPTLAFVFALLIDPALSGWGMNRLLKQYLKNN